MGTNKSGGFSKQGGEEMAQKPVLCDRGKIDRGNLIGIKIGMVAQNYPPGVVCCCDIVDLYLVQ